MLINEQINHLVMGGAHIWKSNLTSNMNSKETLLDYIEESVEKH